MRKFCLVFILYFVVTIDIVANSTDSISTFYKNSEYISYTTVTVNASPLIVNGVIDDFLYQTKYNLNALYDWALVGLKLRKEADDIIIFNFMSTEYDLKSDVIKGVGAVVVPGIITFPEIHVNSRMTKKLLPNENLGVNIDVLYSDAFLKKTNAIFKMVPIDSRSCIISLETHVKFGWFFDFFISQSLFRQIMEWRFLRLMKNITNEAVLRETHKNKVIEHKVQVKNR